MLIIFEKNHQNLVISENTIHKNITLSGRVQGVGFRYSARSVASELGVRGFVRNMPDGDVYIEAEGTAQQLEGFIAWCRKGPPGAVVGNVFITEGMVVGFREFL
ncbi:MAG TPA: acylphosphatase [Bacteroidales bacterium]|nr:acylphosphatase [Bacteroidales bacterium]